MPKAKQDKSPMNQATCADCGVKFELPFTPTSDKPVYCNDCFKNKRSQGRGDRRGHDRRDRQMFSAVCDKCGKNCEVPFRPSGGKPIFCDQCFGKSSDRGGGRGRDRDNRGPDKMQELNKKLDTIIDALVAAKIIKLPKEPKAPAPKAVQKKKPAAKKAPAKKVTTKKKPVAKKTTIKKKSTTKKKTTTKKKK
jgi:CxxC-x17-CxxC domain-containing protein